ncbi:MAG: DUF2330 domain-containing protein, partial [Thermoplasmatota archaeon]
MRKVSPISITGTTLMMLLVLTANIPAVNGDGGYIAVKVSEVFESGQNAIIGWDGEVERLYLSVNIYATKETNGFHVVPFPSMPEITLGSLSIFENHTKYLYGFSDKYYDHDGTALGGNYDGEDRRVEILFHDTIGEHDVAVIRVNDVENFKEELLGIVEEIGIDISSWPEELNRIITNYTLDGCNYFSVDNYPIHRDEKTVDPLVYEFETDHLFFPLEISSMLEGDSLIRLALFTDPGIPLDTSIFQDLPRNNIYHGEFLPVKMIREIDKNLAGMFPEGAHHTYVEFELPLSRVRGDLVIREDDLVSWDIYTNRKIIMKGEPFSHDSRYYCPERTIIPDLGLCLLYNDLDYMEKRMLCMDLDDGSVLWEFRSPWVEVWDEWIDFVSTLDIDNDGSSDLLISYHDHGNQTDVMIRLDPLTGEEVPIDTGILDFMPEGTQVFRDANGTEFLALMSSGKMIVIDPVSWELIAELDRTEPNEKYGYGSIPVDDYIMHFWDGIGDGFYFFDGKCRWAWSPFYQMTEEELNRTGYIDDNIIYQFGFGYICEFEYQGEDYFLGTIWNSSHEDDLCLVDMDAGKVIEYLSYDDLPEFRYLWDNLLVDHDNNGQDDLLVLYRKETEGLDYMHIACVNLVLRVKYWDTRLVLERDLLGYEGMKLSDLNEDGTMELLIYSEEEVLVVDVASGEIIREFPGSRLVPGHPDL